MKRLISPLCELIVKPIFQHGKYLYISMVMDPLESVLDVEWALKRSRICNDAWHIVCESKYHIPNIDDNIMLPVILQKIQISTLEGIS